MSGSQYSYHCDCYNYYDCSDYFGYYQCYGGGYDLNVVHVASRFGLNLELANLKPTAIWEFVQGWCTWGIFRPPSSSMQEASSRPLLGRVLYEANHCFPKLVPQLAHRGDGVQRSQWVLGRGMRFPYDLLNHCHRI